jgi:L-alanine-DL-glutamate epimerase-like enolase superfamily enzyme
MWKLWGGRNQILRTDVTIVIGSLEESLQQARQYYRQGFRAFKIKVGQEMDLDIKRVIGVAAIVKGSVIILDANQGFDVKGILNFIKEIHRYGVKVALLEQPVKKGNWQALADIGRQSGLCVCADESVSSLRDALSAIEQNAVGAINIKLMKTGIVESVAIAQLARVKGLKLMIGGMMESNIAMTAAAHVAVGLGVFDFIDLDTPFFIKGEQQSNPYLSSRGVYRLSKTISGIGL